MSEKPIIFSGPMICAILDGRKSQTRRVVKPQPVDVVHINEPECESHYFDDVGDKNDPDAWAKARVMNCPYGVPGDELWVRETFAVYQTVDHVRRPDGRAFSEVSDGLAAYRADGHDSIADLKEHIKLTSPLNCEAVEVDGDRWRPSIYMPRWASRIQLVVKDVRVERVREIGEEDVQSEGCALQEWSGGLGWPRTAAFAELWDSINGKKPGCSWQDNPCCWCVSFEVKGEVRRTNGKT